MISIIVVVLVVSSAYGALPGVMINNRDSSWASAAMNDPVNTPRSRCATASRTMATVWGVYLSQHQQTTIKATIKISTRIYIKFGA